ncbi:putative lipase atg15 [Hanseniaspora osmophila]|uniref:Putative lipase ATG15 n=1 Tax=Hanseniaspora osmophila TaxID=56408 RepID=A0A1E5REQ1_9ASCO|nr:putative lipase ATG15 [Hanseniaspora osmophila]
MIKLTNSNGKDIQDRNRNKLPRKFSHLKITLTGVLILCIVCIATYTSKSLGVFIPKKQNSKNTINGDHFLAEHSQTANNKGTFKLKHAFRHGVGEHHSLHQMYTFTDNLLYDENQLLSMQSKDPQQLQTAEEQQRFALLKQHAEMYPNHEIGLSTETIKLHRMKNRDPDFVTSYLDYSLEHPELSSKINIDWDFDQPVLAPNVSDKDTVLGLATMASNAYVRNPHEDQDWRNVSDPWKSHMSHGWDGSGVRGHVFANDNETLVVIALKGTSSNGIPGGGGETETIENDKINDNLLFSCCCARISYLWTTVCDCYKKSYTCDQRCLEKELRRKDRYFEATLDIYRNVTKLYPNADIWVTGHSLGGSLASFLGRTFGLPVVAFEAPGELLATKRLHLPMPPGLPTYQEGVYHFGHTADPIFVGTCNGASSSCSIGGYAMETRCHSGKVCIYDVVKDKGWRVNLLNHRIHTVIDEVLMKYDEVAKCVTPEPCIDCYNWRYTLEKDPKPDPKPKPDPSTKPKDSSSLSTSTIKITVTPTTVRTSKSKTHSSTQMTTTASSTCVGRNIFGWCTKYETLI